LLANLFFGPGLSARCVGRKGFIHNTILKIKP
jgi:hypothetical protein